MSGPKSKWGEPGKIWVAENEEIAREYGAWLSRKIDEELYRMILSGGFKEPPKPTPPDRKTFEETYQLELREREEEQDNDAIEYAKRTVDEVTAEIV